ncbi:type II toxin-antitoxin system VapC family toxin [Galbitalea sp. SE-J8]|uniref:type II toxin-antitoxin system VapC family toxin n=1 Tax=Galbitalea sp. SE-J8 TaxID=3054952 RepID=UPI00259D0E20|nr:type II toxin-antitoxin system VapC family toxin [Galbitalea sp. SE-J8]MDM4762099.1 type II toxin-antitoxin system VapC family toxin [Galbitalea sp. SE-J8]
MIVLDASVLVEVLLGLPLAGRVRARIADPDVALHAPQLVVLEVAQVLRRRVASGHTAPRDADAALETLLDLDIVLHDHALLARRVWRLRDNLTAYDAAYVALSELLGAPLLTADTRLARAPGHEADVELVALD